MEEEVILGKKEGLPAGWEGMRVRILSDASTDPHANPGDAWVQPIDGRPDSYGMAPFNWPFRLLVFPKVPDEEVEAAIRSILEVHGE